MELLFLSYSVRIELIFMLIAGGIALLMLCLYGYVFLRQIQEIFFGTKKRDALLNKRNSELLQKRKEDEKIENEDTPPPIILAELNNVDAVNIDELEDVHISWDAISWDADNINISPLEWDEIHANGESLDQDDTEKAANSEEHEVVEKESTESEQDLSMDTDTAWQRDTEDDINTQEDDAVSQSQNIFEWDISTDIEASTDSHTSDTQDESDEIQKMPTWSDITKNESQIEESSPQTQSTSSTEIESPNTEKASTEQERHIEELFEMTNNARTLFARGQKSDARAIIVAGLALKKDHRDLTLLLWEIYESEEKFSQAELVYKDLAHLYPEDHEILTRLASILVITKKYLVAYEMYKKILTLIGNDEDPLYVITHLAKELGFIDDVYTYAKLYLKSWPTNKDILALMAEAEIELGKRKDAIQTLIKLKNLSPYDAGAITDMIAKLVAEEELAENFGDTTHS